MTLTKELLIETNEKLIKLIKEGNPLWSMTKDDSFSSQMCLNLVHYKRNGVVKKGKNLDRS